MEGDNNSYGQLQGQEQQKDQQNHTQNQFQILSQQHQQQTQQQVLIRTSNFDSQTHAISFISLAKEAESNSTNERHDEADLPTLIPAQPPNLTEHTLSQYGPVPAPAPTTSASRAVINLPHSPNRAITTLNLSSMTSIKPLTAASTNDYRDANDNSEFRNRQAGLVISTVAPGSQPPTFSESIQPRWGALDSIPLPDETPLEHASPAVLIPSSRYDPHAPLSTPPDPTDHSSTPMGLIAPSYEPDLSGFMGMGPALNSNNPIYSPPPRNPSPTPDPYPYAEAVSADGVGGMQDMPIFGTRIPRKVKDPPKEKHEENYDEYDMLGLQQRYRDFENKLRTKQNMRADVEKTLNAYMRAAHGRNLELDDTFSHKKKDQRELDEEISGFKEGMRKISDKIFQKYQIRILPKEVASQPLTKRARMSTASVNQTGSWPQPATKPKPPTEPESKRNLLDLNDHHLWCEQCDEHFASLDEYCSHLHKREHTSNMRTSAPWRQQSPKQLDLSRTYDTLKSICQKAANELDPSFKFSDLDLALDPSLRPNSDSLKARGLAREQGNLEDQDVLFHLKGYELLVPIRGFFCTLCDRTMCDADEARQHLKGYSHNEKHIKNLILNSTHETNFRKKLSQSFQKYKSDQPRSKICSPKKKSQAEQTPSANGPAIRYKKATSHIVDNHETVVERFSKPSSERRDVPSVGTNVSRQPEQDRPQILDDEKTSSDSESVNERSRKRTRRDRSLSPPRKHLKANARETVEIIKPSQKPAALKRLRSEPTKIKLSRPPSKAENVAIETRSEDRASPLNRGISSEYDDFRVIILDTDEEEELEDCDPPTIQIYAGDPESPWPLYDLCVSGNCHSRILKDKKLAAPVQVPMPRVNLDDFKDIMLDPATVMTRIASLVAKKEMSPQKTKQMAVVSAINAKTSTAPVPFTKSGGVVVSFDAPKKPKSNRGTESHAGSKRNNRNASTRKAIKQTARAAKSAGFTSSRKRVSADEDESEADEISDFEENVSENQSEVASSSSSPARIRRKNNSDDKTRDEEALRNFFLE